MSGPQQAYNKRLASIYSALDMHNYSKVANKLTSDDDEQVLLLFALRAHALDKCGKTQLAMDCILRILCQLFPDHEWLEWIEHRWHSQLSSSSEEEASSEEIEEDKNVSLLLLPSKERQQVLWNHYKQQQQQQQQQQQNQNKKATTAKSTKSKKKKEKEPIVPAIQQLDETLLATCAVTIKAVHGWQTLADMYLLAAKSNNGIASTNKEEEYYSAFMSHAFLKNWNVSQQMAMKLHNRLDYCALSALNQPENSPLSQMLAKRWLVKLSSSPSSSISYEHIVLQMRAFNSPQEALTFLQQTKQTLLHPNNHPTAITFHDENDFNANTQGRPVSLQQLHEWQVDFYLQLQKYDEALQVLTDELLVILPNQWSYWKQVLHCTQQLHPNHEDAVQQHLREIVDTITQNNTTNTKGEKKLLLRGPKLILLEVMKNHDLQTFVSTLQEYILSVSPKAICCFQDIRNYLTTLVSTAMNGDNNNENEGVILSMLNWAMNQWKSHSSNTFTSTWTLDDLQTYICLIKVLYQLIQSMSSSQPSSDTHNDQKRKLLLEYTPTVEEMVVIYEQSLTSIQVTNNKQVLPGDDLILLAAQRLLNTSTCQEDTTQNYKYAAALLEHAIQHSPFNASLKLMGLQIYFQLGAIQRCWELYISMDIKQVQLDSCSYVILLQGILQQGAFYQEACQLASSILHFHKNVPYNVYEYSSRAMSKGHLSKACEILNFYHDRTKKSIMLRHAQHVLLECVPITKTPKLYQALQEAEEHCWKLLHQSQWEYAAPSLLLTKDDDEQQTNSKTTKKEDEKFSDNRDNDIFLFEILPITSSSELLLSVNGLWNNACESATIQSIGLYSTLLVSGMKKNKKKSNNKKTVASNPTYMLQRAKCLFRQLQLLKKYDDEGQCVWKQNIYKLAHALLVAATGLTDEEQITGEGGEMKENSSTVLLGGTEREEKVVCILEEIAFDSMVDNEKNAVWNVNLPRYILPFWNLINMIGTIFQQHLGWGKLKTTKAASVALRKMALSFRDVLTLYDESICSDDDNFSADNSPNPLFLKEKDLNIVLNHITKSKMITKERVHSVLEQMKESLDPFDV